jgi:signal transduction histidine kinase
MTHRLLASYLTITVLVLVVLVVPLGLTFSNHERDVLLAGIERDAHAVAATVEESLEAGAVPRIDPLLRQYATDGGRIVVVNTAGLAVADSAAVGGVQRDFSTRPEIKSALAGHRAEGIRSSKTLGQRLMYVAVPASSGGVVHGAVRISYPTTELDRRVRQYWLRLAAVSGGVLLAVGAVGLLLARGVTGPVRNLESVAQRISRGDLTVRAATGSGAPELRRLGGTVNAMADRLQQLITAQRSFIADAAHQLRTPLTALRLRLETLESSLPQAEQAKVDAAVAETVRLGQLVDALLVLARADSGAAEPTSLDAAAVASGRVDVWTIAAQERDVRIEARIASTAPVQAVPGGIEQILDNLLSNAISASPPHGTVEIEVRQTSPEWVEIRVTDEGPGLDEQQRAQAFERFWRAPGAKPGSGFGLGLAIARRLAETCGGTLELATADQHTGLRAVLRLRASLTSS